MQKIMIKKIVLYFSLFGYLISCQDNKQLLTDTPTSGEITIVVDETYRPIMDSEQMVFQSHYPKAKINIIYKPALDILKDIDNDSIRMLITSMPLDSGLFQKFYTTQKYFPSTTILAKDAVALVANNQRKGLQMTLQEFAKICKGEITDFSQIKDCKFSGKITLVFDNQKSSTVQYIQDSVLHGEAITSKAFAQKSNTEVLSYVEKNPNAIGVIGASWISDNADIETLAFSKNIFPIQVALDDKSHYYEPHAGYIATHMYPLRRYMNATLKENGAALGRGFLNFICGEIGQRIILKSGIVPATAPTRVVETRKEL